MSKIHWGSLLIGAFVAVAISWAMNKRRASANA